MSEPASLDPELLAIIVCPRCHAALQAEAGQEGSPLMLQCSGESCGLRYPVRDGIPILLVDEAERDS